MTLAEMAQAADRTQDRTLARKVANWLRFHCGMNYADSLDWAKRKAGLDADQFEELMSLADEG